MNPGKILASLTGMALLAALAWHQVREKPQLTGPGEESMIVGTVLENASDAPEPGEDSEALADSDSQPCRHDSTETGPEIPCPDPADTPPETIRGEPEDGV